MADGSNNSDDHRKMVISSAETEKMVERLNQEPFNLSRSECFRVGTKFLYDYLIENRLPDEG